MRWQFGVCEGAGVRGWNRLVWLRVKSEFVWTWTRAVISCRLGLSNSPYFFRGSVWRCVMTFHTGDWPYRYTPDPTGAICKSLRRVYWALMSVRRLRARERLMKRSAASVRTGSLREISRLKTSRVFFCEHSGWIGSFYISGVSLNHWNIRH